MFRAHVLIIRRSKLHYTASGIITPIGGRLMHKTATYKCDDTRGCVMQFWPPDDEHMCSKHVEAWNKLIVKLILCIKLVKYWDKYTEMHGQQNIKIHTSSILNYHLLSINMWSIWMWVFPSGEVLVYLWMFQCRNIVPLTRFFDVAKFTFWIPLSLLS